MNINTLQATLDFQMYCEAKHEMLGTRDAYKAWDNINAAFEDFNAGNITLERMQEIVKGYILYGFDTEELNAPFEERYFNKKAAIAALSNNIPEELDKIQKNKHP